MNGTTRHAVRPGVHAAGSNAHAAGSRAHAEWLAGHPGGPNGHVERPGGRVRWSSGWTEGLISRHRWPRGRVEWLTSQPERSSGRAGWPGVPSSPATGRGRRPAAHGFNFTTKTKETDMPSQSLPEKINDWEVLNTNLKADLEAMPHLRDSQVELEALILRAKDLESQQELQKAQLRDTNKQRRDVALLGAELRRRLAARLAGELGATSERLIKYGLKPRVFRRVRRAKPEEPTTTPTAPPAAS